jgi:hypothetical protein
MVKYFILASKDDVYISPIVEMVDNNFYLIFSNKEGKTRLEYEPRVDKLKSLDINNILDQKRVYMAYVENQIAKVMPYEQVLYEFILYNLKTNGTVEHLKDDMMRLSDYSDDDDFILFVETLFQFNI